MTFSVFTSISTNKSSPSTLSPTLTKTRLTTPDDVAGTDVSIFMAERVATVCPSLISSPGLTVTPTTTPGIGLPTVPGAPAFSLTAPSTAALLSVTLM
ncbi:unnamed protein product [Pseudo-nitzschia multistriata]|uniref:Uncharacterized protein n=1 Tax=Pseudo-nitzschia multistriata TaxID=183589 RepID=A0A448Z5F5_9STRA|nr:unnamed protein product [Pseudo-nitzschia multistriata]